VLLYVITSLARLAILSRQENVFFSFHEQRICVKIKISVAEIFEMVKTAFREEAMGRIQTYEW
jgi:hypothetical protein